MCAHRKARRVLIPRFDGFEHDDMLGLDETRVFERARQREGCA